MDFGWGPSTLFPNPTFKSRVPFGRESSLFFVATKPVVRNIFIRAFIGSEATPPLGNLMLPAGDSGASSSEVAQRLPVANQIEIPPQEVDEDEVWREAHAQNNDKSSHRSLYYETRVNLRDLLKSQVDSQLNKKLSVNKYRKIIELLGDDSAESFLEISQEISQNQNESHYFQKALRIARDLLSKGVKDRDLESYVFRER